MERIYSESNSIKTERGEEFILRGINFGGWLLMEGYILGGRNIPEAEFKKEFERKNGKKSLKEFEELFQDNFIREADFRRVREWGVNSVRIPFNYKVLESDSEPFKYRKKGLQILERILNYAQKYKIYVILDMHAVPGSQNKDWHSDSTGRALFWKYREYRERFFRLWEFLTDFCKDKNCVAGFDLMNEPVLTSSESRALKEVYKEAIRRVRKIDKNVLLFLEPNNWAQDLEGIKDIEGENLVFSVHTYLPLEFTFNFVKNLRYPGKIGKVFWNKERLRNYIFRYKKISDKMRRPIHIGEFGINFRSPSYYGELHYLKDLLEIFEEFRFSWSYWTYKAISTGIFPDGILQYTKNPDWVRREGPVFGWENYIELWPKYKREIIHSWRSEEFEENKFVLGTLKKFLKSC